MVAIQKRSSTMTLLKKSSAILVLSIASIAVAGGSLSAKSRVPSGRNTVTVTERTNLIHPQGVAMRLHSYSFWNNFGHAIKTTFSSQGIVAQSVTKAANS